MRALRTTAVRLGLVTAMTLGLLGAGAAAPVRSQEGPPPPPEEEAAPLPALAPPFGSVDPRTIGVTRSLRLGDTGADVAAVQGLLHSYGYAVPLGGTYDTATEAEVRRYQDDNGITADGWIGAQTARRLRIVWAPPVTAAVPRPAQSAATGGLVPGRCASYAGLAAQYGLPWGIFSRIAWRESGCNHRVYVSDHDDEGGGLLGLNFKGSLASHWRKLCGASVGQVTNASVNIRCAAAEYRARGTRAWR